VGPQGTEGCRGGEGKEKGQERMGRKGGGEGRVLDEKGSWTPQIFFRWIDAFALFII